MINRVSGLMQPYQRKLQNSSSKPQAPQMQFGQRPAAPPFMLWHCARDLTTEALARKDDWRLMPNKPRNMDTFFELKGHPDVLLQLCQGNMKLHQNRERAYLANPHENSSAKALYTYLQDMQYSPKKS